MSPSEAAMSTELRISFQNLHTLGCSRIAQQALAGTSGYDYCRRLNLPSSKDSVYTGGGPASPPGNEMREPASTSEARRSPQ